jgi:TRAP-type C4-dicarboxylate transport system permease small subunit
MSDEGFAGGLRVHRLQGANSKSVRVRVRPFFVLINLFGLLIAHASRPYWQPWFDRMNDGSPWLLYAVVLPLPIAVALVVIRHALSAREKQGDLQGD